MKETNNTAFFYNDEEYPNYADHTSKFVTEFVVRHEVGDSIFFDDWGGEEINGRFIVTAVTFEYMGLGYGCGFLQCVFIEKCDSDVVEDKIDISEGRK